MFKKCRVSNTIIRGKIEKVQFKGAKLFWKK